MTKKKVTKKKFEKVDTYQLITERVLAKLEEGVVPWKKPWKMSRCSGGFESAQKNAITGKSYQGFNVMLTEMASFNSDFWMTFKQAKEKGGKVMKGEKSTPIIYWQMIVLNEIDEKTGEKKKIPMLKHFNIFNLDQIENLDEKFLESLYKVEEVSGVVEQPEFETIELAEQIVANFKTCCNIGHGGGRAYYSPSADKIQMPNKEDFKSNEEYYSTLFHELVHSTGHVSRLNRDGVTNPTHFGSHEYSKEELVAEFGNCFLTSECGIESTFNNSAAYIKSWSKALKEDKKLLIQASGQARKAAKYIMNIETVYEEDDKKKPAKKKAAKKKATKKKTKKKTTKKKKELAIAA